MVIDLSGYCYSVEPKRHKEFCIFEVIWYRNRGSRKCHLPFFVGISRDRNGFNNFGLRSDCTAFKKIVGMRLSVITVMVITVTASLSPGINSELNALLRFIESCIGAVVAYVLVALWPKS